MSFLRALVPALFAGALFAAALPPAGQWWLAWFWMLPVFWKLWPSEGVVRPRRLFWYGFRHGWLAGFCMFTATLWWVGHVTIPGMIAMCMYLALYPAVWGGFAARMRPGSPGRGLLAALALALLWAGLEWLRGTVITGFPWNGAAVPLAEMPGLRALASWTGVTGLSALPVFFMSGLAAAWTLRHHRNVRSRALALCSTLALPAVVTLLLWEKSPQPESHLQVMLVQPNFPRVEPGEDPDVTTDELRERWEKQQNDQRNALRTLTLGGLDRRPQLIVWPESGLPGEFNTRDSADLFKELFAAGADTFLAGADVRRGIDEESENNMAAWVPQNCAVLMRGDYWNHQIYAKVHLVPFGEYIPFRDKLPFLEKWLGQLIPMDFTPGTETYPLRLEGMDYEIIPLVCFEDTIAPLAREFVKPGPQLMVNITNDNWFYQSNESAIHAINARWRCIELRRPMVRASLTGVTCVIDTEGRITDEMPRWQPGVLHAKVPIPPGEMTFYALHGELFSVWFGAGGFVLALIFIRTRPRHER